MALNLFWIGIIGAVVSVAAGFIHVIRYFLKKDLFAQRYDIYLYYACILLLLIYAISLMNAPFIIYFAGLVLLAILTSLPLRKK